MNTREVGEGIRRLRERRGWSQTELGERADLNKETVNRVELGANVRFDTYEKLLVALDARFIDLLGNAEVHPGTFDVSGYTPDNIPLIAEGEASPVGTVFWDQEGKLKSEVESRMSRPADVRDPKAYGIRVRGDSMEPMFKAGMKLIVSPNVPVGEGDAAYVQLVNGERLIKIVHRTEGGYILESVNRVYEPRFVKREEVEHVHRIAYARLLR